MNILGYVDKPECNMSANYLSSLHQEWYILLDSLSEGLLGSFININDELTAVVRIYQTKGISNIFAKWLKKLNNSDSNNILLEKSIGLANKWRESGNVFYNLGDYETSLKYYNLSLLSAPRDDKAFPYSLANRSAILTKQKKYKEAIANIDLAIENGYPESKIQKLKQRRLVCQNCIDTEITNGNTDENVLAGLSSVNLNEETLKFENFPTPYDCFLNTLLPNRHANIEEMGKNVELKYSESQGRYIVTTEDVKRGEVLFVEKPFAFVALPGPNGVLPTVCENCCTAASYPIPCSQCAGSIYCSEACRIEAWRMFHEWECNGTSKLLWPSIGIAHLALRVLLVGSHEKFGLEDKLDESLTVQEIMEEIKTSNTACGVQFGYQRVYNLVTNFDKMTPKDFLQYALTSIMLTMYLKHHTDFMKFITESIGGNSSDVEIAICCLILRHLGQMVSSGHAICGTCEDDHQEIRQTRIATAIFPSASMMNHSCDSNIINNHYDSLLIVRASRDIPNGGEVFNCYGPSYKIQRGETRRKLLRGQYTFDCKCTACTSKEKDNFSDIFKSYQCSNCFGPVFSRKAKISFNCTKCAHKIQIRQIQQHVDDSLKLYKLAKNEDSSTLEEVFNVYKIQGKYLMSFNSHLSNTMDLMAKKYAKDGKYDESIHLLNKIVNNVKRQYGEDSIEVGHELQKLCDVMISKLYKYQDRTCDGYGYTLNNVIDSNRDALEIFLIAYGSWTPIYKETKKRQEEFNQLLKTYLRHKVTEQQAASQQ